MNPKIEIIEFSQKYNIDSKFVRTICNDNSLKIAIANIVSEQNIGIEIIQFVYNTDYFPNLDKKLQTLRQELSETNTFEKRYKIGEEIIKTEAEVKEYYINILNTANSLYSSRTVSSIDVVREFFFNGKIKNAFDFFDNTALEANQNNLNDLLNTQKQLMQVYQNLTCNAEEYLVKAQLQMLNLDICNPQNRFLLAVEFYNKGKVSADRSKQQSFIGEYNYRYARFLEDHNQFNGALPLFKSSLQIFKQLSIKNSEKYIPYVAKNLNSLANIESKRNELVDAEEFYANGIEILRDLEAKDSDLFLPILTGMINNLGELHRITNQLDKSEPLFREALDKYQSLSKNDPNLYTPFVAIALNNLGLLYKQRKDFEQAEVILVQALTIRRKLLEENKELYLPYVAKSLNNLANLYADVGKKFDAETMYLDALKIRKELSLSNPNKHLPSIANTISNLAQLYKELGRKKEAEPLFYEVLDIYKNLSKINVNTYLPYVALVSINIAIFYYDSLNNKSLSLSFTKQAYLNALPFKENLNMAKQVMALVNQLIVIWGVSIEELIATHDI